MQFLTKNHNSMQWLHNDLAGARTAMFTRHGGVSLGPFTSLNLSFGVGDDSGRVGKNRALVKEVSGLLHLVSARQVHSDQVKIMDRVDRDLEVAGVDALVTNQPNVGLLIQQADCQAVLLHDPVRQVIAAVHSGWRGSVGNIIARTIAVMQENYGTKPADLLAAISPSLGPCCAQFVHAARELPRSFNRFRTGSDHFDFWSVSKNQLQQCGVTGGNIRIAAICSRCSSDFFSYRRATARGDGMTGRNGSIIMLPPESAQSRRPGGHDRKR